MTNPNFKETKLKITHDNHHNVEWTEYYIRACAPKSGTTEWQIEFNTEHYLHKFMNKRGTTHYNAHAISIKDAIKIRDALTIAIENANERTANND